MDGSEQELNRLREEMLEWMSETGDPILEDYQTFLAGELGDFSGPQSPGLARKIGAFVETLKK